MELLSLFLFLGNPFNILSDAGRVDRQLKAVPHCWKRWYIWRRKLFTKFEDVTAVKMSMLFFRIVTPCGLVGRYEGSGGTFCLYLQISPEGGDSMFLPNVGINLQVHTALQFRRATEILDSNTDKFRSVSLEIYCTFHWYKLSYNIPTVFVIKFNLNILDMTRARIKLFSPNSVLHSTELQGNLEHSLGITVQDSSVSKSVLCAVIRAR
jgi:hypothetical protein